MYAYKSYDKIRKLFKKKSIYVVMK